MYKNSQYKCNYSPTSLFNQSLRIIFNNDDKADLNYLKSLSLPLDDKEKIFLVEFCTIETHNNKEIKYWIKEYRCTQKELIIKNHLNYIYLKNIQIRCKTIEKLVFFTKLINKYLSND